MSHHHFFEFTSYRTSPDQWGWLVGEFWVFLSVPADTSIGYARHQADSVFLGPSVLVSRAQEPSLSAGVGQAGGRRRLKVGREGILLARPVLQEGAEFVTSEAPKIIVDGAIQGFHLTSDCTVRKQFLLDAPLCLCCHQIESLGVARQ